MCYREEWKVEVPRKGLIPHSFVNDSLLLHNLARMTRVHVSDATVVL